LDPGAQAALAAYQLSPTNSDGLAGMLVSNLNTVVSGPSIYEANRFQASHWDRKRSHA
jgi:hypothetical protein